MMSRCRCKVYATVLMGTLLLGFSNPAQGQGAPAVSSSNSALAEVLFKAAMDLMQQKKYAEASRKLEESNRLDPGLGTRFHLAECYEYTHRMASAWGLFLEVAAEAERTGQEGKARTARKRAEQLEARVPKLKIHVPDAVAKIPGVQVRNNDNLVNAPLWDQSLPVDPGEYTLRVTAPGRQPWSKSVNIQEGDAVTIDVPAPRDIPIGPIVLASAGLASIVVGSIFGVRTVSLWDEVVKEVCDNKGDIRKCDKNREDDLRQEKGVDTSASISTAMFIVGGVALAGAATWAFWPKKKSEERSSTALQVTFTPAVGGGGIVVGGAF